MSTVYSTSHFHQSTGDPAWMRKVVTGSLLVLVLISGGPMLHQLLRRKKKDNVPLSGIQPGSLRSLRASIVGQGKQSIAAMLGPPRALEQSRGTTWYYALDNAQRVAMAILFDNERAREVEFFASPER